MNDGSRSAHLKSTFREDDFTPVPTPVPVGPVDESLNGELHACAARAVAEHLAELLDADTLDALAVELTTRRELRLNAPVEYWPTC